MDHMRRSPNLTAIPVIAVTASSLLQEEGAVRERFDGYLRKPFTRAELFRELAHFLPRRAPDSTPRPALLAPHAPDTEARAAAWRLALRKLRQMEISTWAALQNTQATTEAKDFAWRLQLLAETADCPPLRTYADTLRTHATNFAADELEKHLAAFPSLLTLLEERSAPA